MRRALRKELPALTRFYGLLPEHLERMTFGEIAEYRQQMHDALSEDGEP